MQHDEVLGGAGRRHDTNLYLSLLVDLGLCYRHAFGADAASSFLAQHAVPAQVVTRICEAHPVRQKSRPRSGHATAS